MTIPSSENFQQLRQWRVHMPQDSQPVAMCRHGDSLILAGHCPKGPGLDADAHDDDIVHMVSYGQKYQNNSIHHDP